METASCLGPGGATERSGLGTGEDRAQTKALEGPSAEEKTRTWPGELDFRPLCYVSIERLFLEGAVRGGLEIFSHHLGRKRSLSKTSLASLFVPTPCAPQRRGSLLGLAHSGLRLVPVGGSSLPSQVQ